MPVASNAVPERCASPVRTFIWRYVLRLHVSVPADVLTNRTYVQPSGLLRALDVPCATSDTGGHVSICQLYTPIAHAITRKRTHTHTHMYAAYRATTGAQRVISATIVDHVLSQDGSW